jgi:hypothetical protein
MLRLLFFILLSGCASYPGWQQVRIEKELPLKCEYKAQESCNLEGNNCYDWHRKRATNYGANTVIIVDFRSQQAYMGGIWLSEGVTINSTLADYYFCNKGNR